MTPAYHALRISLRSNSLIKDRLLVIGLGNLLMGDDGVGIHVINELKKYDLSENLDVIDGGTAGVDLIDILSSYRKVIVIDAVMDKGDDLTDIKFFSTGDLLLREDDSDYSLHDMELTSVLSLMKTLDVDIPDIKIIGIPAAAVTPGIKLSKECERLVPEAVELILTMHRKIKNQNANIKGLYYGGKP